MKKETTELIFILDRSGSMYGLEQDTIGGFNSMLEKQKKEDGETIVTTVLFDDRYELLHDRFPIEAVGKMTDKEYFVRGSTALLDAVGSTVQKIANAQGHLPKENRADKVIFVIITDGMENASVEYSYKTVRKMIEAQKATGNWEFMFLGANMDAVEEAGKFGIGADRSVTYACDSTGTQLNFKVVEETIHCMRCAPSMAEIGGEWKEAIEEDLRVRGKR